jgi:hypothetical protein
LENSCLFAPALPFSPEADPKGEHNQAHIQPQGLFVDIEEIIAEFAAWRGILGNIDSGKTGQARSDTQSLLETTDIFIPYHLAFSIPDNLTYGQGPWSYKTHITPENIDELG